MTGSSDINWEAILASDKQLGRITAEELRADAELVQIPCATCGRRMIVTCQGSGKTLVVCRHIWEAIRRRAREVPPGELKAAMLDPASTRIELFDDGPARW